MAVAPAMAQTNTVYAGQTTPLTVVDLVGDTYTWELYNEVTGINFAVTPGNCPPGKAIFQGEINTGSSVNVTWLKAGTYFFKVTAVKAGCTDNLKIGKITVSALCRGSLPDLTAIMRFMFKNQARKSMTFYSISLRHFSGAVKKNYATIAPLITPTAHAVPIWFAPF